MHDKNDWITNCGVQAQVSAPINQAITKLPPHKIYAGRPDSCLDGHVGGSILFFMDLSISHDIASFLEDANRLLRRLRLEG